MIERLIITLTPEGAFRGASAKQHGNPLPLPITEENLAPIAEVLDAAALARVAELESEVATLASEKTAALAEVHRLTALVGVPAGAVTQWQFRMALIAAGILPSDITLALSAIEDEAARETALTDWTHAATIRRDHPLIASLATQLGKTSKEVDAIFAAAALL
jgi:hypothetical protein